MAGNSNNPIDQMLDSIRRLFNFKNSSIAIIIILVAVSIWTVKNWFYIVDVDEVAVIQRFGKYYKTEGSGAHWKLPDFIDKKTNVKVLKTHIEEFGEITLKAGVRTEYAPETKKSVDVTLMLTGDKNCALVPWVVRYRISDPVKYLFNVQNQVQTLRDLSEASMRLVIGDRSIHEVITGREDISKQVKVELQKALDYINIGVAIKNIELKTTNVPKPVQPSFNEVNQAQQEKEKMIYQAQEDYNKIIPAAKGEADQMISNAEAYSLDRINKAKGDSARFVSLYNEYSKSKDATRRRMYLETMRDLLPKLGNKYIVDSEQKNLLPLLNMEAIGGKK